MNSSGKDTIQPKRLKERNINSGTPIDVSIRPYTIPHKAYLVTSRPKACDYKLTFSLASGMVVNTYETRETQSGKMGPRFVDWEDCHQRTVPGRKRILTTLECMQCFLFLLTHNTSIRSHLPACQGGICHPLLYPKYYA